MSQGPKRYARLTKKWLPATENLLFLLHEETPIESI